MLSLLMGDSVLVNRVVSQPETHANHQNNNGAHQGSEDDVKGTDLGLRFSGFEVRVHAHSFSLIRLADYYKSGCGLQRP